MTSSLLPTIKKAGVSNDAATALLILAGHPGQATVEGQLGKKKCSIFKLRKEIRFFLFLFSLSHFLSINITNFFLLIL